MRPVGVVIMVVVVTVALSGCGSTSTTEESPGGSTPGNPAAYLDHVKTTWTGDIPGDSVLLSYGKAACQQLADGEDLDEVQIEMDDATSALTEANTRSVLDAAPLSLCPTALVD